MSLDAALESAIGEVPDCVAGAYLDLTTGLVLAIHADDPDDEDTIETVAASLPDLFEGRAFEQVASTFGKTAEAPESGAFNEFMVFGSKHIHLFLRSQSQPDNVLSLVCRRDAKIGLVLARSRKTVETVAASV